MPRTRRYISAALFFFLVAGLKPLIGQSPLPEFFITVAPSVVTVVQGEATSLTVTITCNTSSLAVAADCNAWPKFDLHLSEFPDGANAETAAGRVGPNTISISTSSETAAGAFPIQVTVVAGNTTQAQTFILNVRQAATALSGPQALRQPVDAPAGPLLTWEHHVLVAKTPEEFGRKENNLGRDSWELVSVITRQNIGTAEWIGFFKRPKRAESQLAVEME